MDGRDHVRRAIRHYLEKDEDLRENPEDQAALMASIQAAFVLARAAVAAARDARDMTLRLDARLQGRPSNLHRHYEAIWRFLGGLWELIDFCELEQEVATADVEDPVWFFGRALDQQLGGNPFEALAILDEAGLTAGTPDPWVQLLRAEALAAAGEQVEAIRAWERATELDPCLIEAHVSAAGELEALGRAAEAYRHWLAVKKALPRDDPLAAEARRHLARLRHRLLRPEAPRTNQDPQGRLPRWGPAWVPAWPGRAGRRRPVSEPPPEDMVQEPASEAAVHPAPRPGADGDGAVVSDLTGEPAVAGVRTSAGDGEAVVPGRARELYVYVAGADTVSEGLLRSRSAAYLGGGHLVGNGSPDPREVERHEPDLVVLSSGMSAEQCAALAERVREGTLRSATGPVTFVFNGPEELGPDLRVIFDGLAFELVGDICPPPPDPDFEPVVRDGPVPEENGEGAEGRAEGVRAEGDPFAPTLAAVERRVRERRGGRHAPRAAFARGAAGLVPVLGWLDAPERRPSVGRTVPHDLVAVNAGPGLVECVAVREGVVAGATLGPDSTDRGRLLGDLFAMAPAVLPPGETALIVGRLLGEGGLTAVDEGPEAFVASCLTGGLLARAMVRLREILAADTSYGTRSHHLLVGGPLISWLPTPEHALLAAVDGCQPTGVTRLLLDPYGLVASLGEGLVTGRLGADGPSWADAAAALLAGSAVCVAPLVQAVKWGKAGRKLVLEATVKGAWRDGERTWELCRGQLLWVQLPAGRRVELIIRPAAPYNVGRGRGVEWRGEFVAGGLGLVLDGRGRPLRLPEDEVGRTTLQAAWAAEVVGRLASA